MNSHALIASDLWTREPASRPDRVHIRARIAGMHCSLCTGTIEKALRRHAGVEKVAVSLTHGRWSNTTPPASGRKSC